VQTAAILEVVHSMVGMVKSPWHTTLLQVLSRLFVVWAVLDVSAQAQDSVFALLCITSWGLVEVPRYLFYALNLVDMVPYPLFFLRYSLFAVLYPTGITGELGCVYSAAQAVFGAGTFADMAQNNKLHFVFLFLVALSYIPGSPKMYGHMVKTRRKQFKLRKEQEAKRKN
jgi:very-long-chain (3R)-3-hydroxyacyl-CoA dehydratase